VCGAFTQFESPVNVEQLASNPAPRPFNKELKAGEKERNMTIFFSVMAALLLIAVICDGNSRDKAEWAKCFVTVVCGIVILKCLPLFVELIA
jgi:hypothetical protein